MRSTVSSNCDSQIGEKRKERRQITEHTTEAYFLKKQITVVLDKNQFYEFSKN